MVYLSVYIDSWGDLPQNNIQPPHTAIKTISQYNHIEAIAFLVPETRADFQLLSSSFCFVLVFLCFLFCTELFPVTTSYGVHMTVLQQKRIVVPHQVCLHKSQLNVYTIIVFANKSTKLSIFSISK